MTWLGSSIVMVAHYSEGGGCMRDTTKTSHLLRISGTRTTKVVPRPRQRHASRSATSPSPTPPPPALPPPPLPPATLSSLSAAEDSKEEEACPGSGLGKGTGSLRAATTPSAHSSSTAVSYSRPSAGGRVDVEASGVTPGKGGQWGRAGPGEGEGGRGQGAGERGEGRGAMTK